MLVERKSQALKNEGKIRFTQDRKKLKFSVESIKKYLNDHSSSSYRIVIIRQKEYL